MVHVSFCHWLRTYLFFIVFSFILFIESFIFFLKKMKNTNQLPILQLPISITNHPILSFFYKIIINHKISTELLTIYKHTNTIQFQNHFFKVVTVKNKHHDPYKIPLPQPLTLKFQNNNHLKYQHRSKTQPKD